MYLRDVRLTPEIPPKSLGFDTATLTSGGPSCQATCRKEARSRISLEPRYTMMVRALRRQLPMIMPSRFETYITNNPRICRSRDARPS